MYANSLNPFLIHMPQRKFRIFLSYLGLGLILVVGAPQDYNILLLLLLLPTTSLPSQKRTMGIQHTIIEIVGSVLLFFLVLGMSATVDIGCLSAQIKNRKAIVSAMFLQFVVLPFLGFLSVKSLNMNPAMGITLLVVTSSPGGSYSNWWCSMFNADLALSVTLTGISTLISIIMLPVNLLLYVKMTYNADVVKELDWLSIVKSLVIVLSAIGLGLLASAKCHSHSFNLNANRVSYDKECGKMTVPDEISTNFFFNLPILIFLISLETWPVFL
jgi:predicted Na+-dependent transporter